METKKTKECEHELNLIEENWVGGNTFIAIVECNKCKEKFQGLMTKK